MKCHTQNQPFRARMTRKDASPLWLTLSQSLPWQGMIAQNLFDFPLEGQDSFIYVCNEVYPTESTCDGVAIQS